MYRPPRTPPDSISDFFVGDPYPLADWPLHIRLSLYTWGLEHDADEAHERGDRRLATSLRAAVRQIKRAVDTVGTRGPGHPPADTTKAYRDEFRARCLECFAKAQDIITRGDGWRKGWSRRTVQRGYVAKLYPMDLRTLTKELDRFSMSRKPYEWSATM